MYKPCQNMNLHYNRKIEVISCKSSTLMPFIFKNSFRSRAIFYIKPSLSHLKATEQWKFSTCQDMSLHDTLIITSYSHSAMIFSKLEPTWHIFLVFVSFNLNLMRCYSSIKRILEFIFCWYLYKSALELCYATERCCFSHREYYD